MFKRMIYALDRQPRPDRPKVQLNLAHLLLVQQQPATK
jgi:hypothetical protein